jgi:hypothetical protein
MRTLAMLIQAEKTEQILQNIMNLRQQYKSQWGIAPSIIDIISLNVTGS